jgi:uncharacterized membrane protein
MKVSFTRFPIDLALCLICSMLLIPLALFNVANPVRLILGAPFMLFIPGYVLVFALFPFKRRGGSIRVIERIGLSLGASVAIVPLLGLAMNFSPWGIRLESMLLLLCLYIFGVGAVAMYRWYTTIPEERFSVTFNVLMPIFKNRFDKHVTIILGALIVISVILTIYVIVVPKVGERYTEFYVLGVNGTADRYPQNLSIGENATIILGISNHEYRKINYTIEVWLINQTTYFNISKNKNETVVNHYNTSENKNETVINNMWFVDKFTVELNHKPISIENLWTPQWEHNYTFALNQVGNFKFVFLLFTTPSTEHYNLKQDYKDRTNQILESAYREIHLWVTVE